MIDYLDKLVFHQDEPIADWVCIPLYFVSKLARDSGMHGRPGRRGRRRAVLRLRQLHGLSRAVPPVLAAVPRCLPSPARACRRRRWPHGRAACGPTLGRLCRHHRPRRPRPRACSGAARCRSGKTARRSLVNRDVDPRRRRARPCSAPALLSRELQRARHLQRHPLVRAASSTAGLPGQRRAHPHDLQRVQAAAARAAADARRQDRACRRRSRRGCRSSTTSWSSSPWTSRWTPRSRNGERKYLLKKAVRGLHSRRHHRPQEDGLRRADVRMAARRLRPARAIASWSASPLMARGFFNVKLHRPDGRPSIAAGAPTIRCTSGRSTISPAGTISGSRGVWRREPGMLRQRAHPPPPRAQEAAIRHPEARPPGTGPGIRMADRRAARPPGDAVKAARRAARPKTSLRYGPGWRASLSGVVPAPLGRRRGRDVRPGESARILRAAERALRHEVTLLGLRNQNLGQSIDWHRDYKTGNRWPPAFYRRIEYAGLGAAERRQDPVGDFPPAMAAAGRPGLPAERRRSLCGRSPRACWRIGLRATRSPGASTGPAQWRWRSGS